ncbi:hypothetical protein SJ05684_c10090 [Sinorhizobium sojae CCBAU 05684]|uniref:Uncharacterized protein n=1 Tax=Sinorhizobium sojae CCBAU 05684 TaxID=716928 RepID=A0A249P9U5_9HYPH|nr:hypothetical protein SJ05684_c10090 [Sinorhizobium sojae CCBAU 05684]
MIWNWSPEVASSNDAEVQQPLFIGEFTALPEFMEEPADGFAVFFCEFELFGHGCSLDAFRRSISRLML